MSAQPPDRRKRPRYGIEGTLEFDWPRRGEHRVSFPLRDISHAGLSFLLAIELPGIEIGRNLDHGLVRVGHRKVRGDLVVIHLTPDDSPGSICGAAFYPTSDRDILELKELIAELREQPDAPAGVGR